MRKLLLNPTPLFRKLRQLSLLLSLLLVPAMAWGQTTYDIWIGDFENNGSFTGTQVTSANATDVLGNGTVSYADGVLTLNGANIQGTIYIKESLTIDLKGKNYITANDSSAITNVNSVKGIDLTFKSTDGTGFLTTVAKPTNYPCSNGFNEATYENGLSCLSGGLRFADGAYEYAAIGQHLFSGGTGASSDEAYIIATAADLKDFSSYVNKGWITTNGKYFKLSPSSGSTIDCTGLTGFQPIGIEGNEPIKFKGTFDGNKKTIKNLSITGIVGAYVGLFRCLDGGTITQLTLDGCTISGGTSSSDNIGGIVGNVSSGTVSNCIVQNSAISCSENSQNPYVGGIVGALEGGEITGCVFQDSYVKAEPSANSGGINSYAGGIAGNAASGTISNCQVKGTAEISAICTNQSTYAGAIAGNRIGVTLSNNTYDSSVKTKVQNSTITELTTYSGYTERGIGSAPGSSSSDEIGKVELAGTKKITITPSLIGGESIAKDGTYYLMVDNQSNNTYDVYALPGNEVGINATPIEGYKPRLTLSDATIEVTATEVKNPDTQVYTRTEFTFTVGNTDLTATLTFPIDIASATFTTATIADGYYTGVPVVPTQMKLNDNSGNPLYTLTTTNNDFTITGYKLSGTAVDEPVDAGTYTVTVEGKNDYIGTRDVSYKIIQTYALKIAGTQVNENNAANVFGSAGTATVSFTPATESNPTNTLTLNAYQNNSNAAIVSSLPNLTIVINGESSIGDNSGTDGFIQSTNANATLTFKKGSDNSTLTLHASNDDAVVQGFASVSYDETYYSYSSAINYNTSAKRYESRNTQLTLLTITTLRHYPIWIAAVPVTDDNKDNLESGCATFTPGTDTTPNTLLLNGASILSMTAIESDLDNLTISLIGDNTLSTYYNGYNPIYSFNPDAELIIKQAGDADCTLGLSTTGQDPVIKGFKSVSHKSVSDTPLYFVSKTGATLDGATTYDAVLSSATIYPLWIDGTMVTEANKNAILGAGNTKVTYDGDTNNGGTNTLTLNKYSYTGNAADGHAIETNITGLKVKLVGENTINCENNSKYDSNYAFYTYLSTASIQFVKDDATSKLTLQTTPANPFGGFADGKITYDGLVYYSEGTYIAVPTAPTMAEDNNKVKLTINYSGGTIAIKYSIDYADETADVTEATYSEPFAMTAPGTVEAWVEANGATTENDKVKGKYFGFKDAPFTLKADLVDQSKSETLTPVLIPAFVDGENIALKTTGTYESSAEGVATFADGTITAKGIGTATVTANIDYTGDVQPVVILNHEKKVTAEVNVGVTPSITFTPDMKYATFCNTGNKDLTVPEGLKAYAITGVNGNVVTLSQVEFLPKVNGTTYFPLLLKREDKNTEVGLSLEYDGTASAPTSNYLRYAISNVQTTGVEFVLYKDEFVKATGTIPEQKCYLYLRGVSFTRGAYDIGDDTTAIDATLIDNEETNDYWFDLQGRRIQKPSKAGLYIKNGKKVIVNTK